MKNRTSPVVHHVLEDDRRPVVAGRRVVRDAVHHALERREDGGAGIAEQVDAEVHRPVLVAPVVRVAEQIGDVDQPRLVVTPDAERGARRRHQPVRRARRTPAGPARVPGVGTSRLPTLRSKTASGARPQVAPHDRGELGPVRGQPGGDCRRRLARLQAAGVAEDCQGPPRRDAVEAFEQLPRLRAG